jgi:hypothetical protein
MNVQIMPDIQGTATDIWLSKDRNNLPEKYWYDILHDHPRYFVCPDLLVAVGENSYGIKG